MLEHFNIQKLYTIDPYELYEGYRQGQMEDYFRKNGQEITYLEVKEMLSEYPQVELIRGFSHDIVERFEDNSVDFCWIDGNHSYEYILQDIQDWFPKVKIGGILAGDDMQLPQVEKAVLEYFKGKDVFKGKRSWFIKKRKGEIYW